MAAYISLGNSCKTSKYIYTNKGQRYSDFFWQCCGGPARPDIVVTCTFRTMQFEDAVEEDVSHQVCRIRSFLWTSTFYHDLQFEYEYLLVDPALSYLKRFENIRRPKLHSRSPPVQITETQNIFPENHWFNPLYHDHLLIFSFYCLRLSHFGGNLCLIFVLPLLSFF